MENYKRILAAVDFSKYSDQVVKHASRLALQLNTELIILHVINKRELDTIHYMFQKISSLTDSLSQEDMVERVRKDREQKMNRLLKVDDVSYIKTRSIIRTGIPEQEINKIAIDFKVDLVIIGEKGRGDLIDTLIGSTAHKVIRSCPTSIFIVRLRKEHRKSRDIAK